MAKKITRGITGIKDINKQDFDTNNVNDLLSDGQYNYIHRKKGKAEEYHNLTDNIKTISSDNTDLLTVTNNNKTNNTATLRPKHDSQKEQVLESERATITIQHGTNATTEKTKVDTNPKKVLEHTKLKTGDGLATLFNTDTTTVVFKPTKKPAGTKISDLDNGIIWGNTFSDVLPQDDPEISATYITLQSDTNTKIQLYMRESVITDGKIVMHYRFIKDGSVTDWRQMDIDNSQLSSLLAQKQNTLTSNVSIGVSGTGLRQLYTLKQNYTHTNGSLKTHVKSVSSNTSVTTPEEEFNFILKINQGQQSATFTLNEHDKTKFSNIMTTYGASNGVRINGALFELNDTTLTVTTESDTSNNYVITFSDII